MLGTSVDPKRSAYLAAKYASRRARIIADLGGVCDNCGTTESLQVDHLDPTNKALEVSTSTQLDWTRIAAEIQKCHLLCFACHLKKASIYLLADGSRVTIRDMKQWRSSPSKAAATWIGWVVPDQPAVACDAGHPFSESNTGHHRGSRYCRTCTKALARRGYHRRNPDKAQPHGLETHCPQGHPYDEANTRLTPEGWRRCRTCHAVTANRARDARVVAAHQEEA